MKINVLSLFSGCGGLDLGFTQEGHYDIFLALDADPVAVQTYNHNRRVKVAQIVDLAKVSVDEITNLVQEKIGGRPLGGVIGGPPCQPFSNGNRSPRDDERRLLPRRYATILNALNAEFDLDFFVFENVRGISFKRHLEIFLQFKDEFEGAGFCLHEDLLDALDFGVPQKRARVFVVGFNKWKYGDRGFEFPSAKIGSARTVGEAIGHLPAPVFYDRKLAADDIPHHPNHWTMRPKSRRFSDGSLEEGQRKGRSFRVLSWNEPSWTVAYGNREIHIHPSGKRRLSIFEAMLLQGFPESYRILGTLSAQVRQVCDAVPPPLAKALARQIWLYLQGDHRERSRPTGQLTLI